jgi:predicted nucleic acid-binding protein
VPSHIFLDSGTLNLAVMADGKPRGDRCKEWLLDKEVHNVTVVVPEIADYEVRRELVRRGATAGLRRLDDLLIRFTLLPLDRPAWLRAAELWAIARKSGTPTAGPDALDGDAILAAQASNMMGAGNVATVATENVRHLGRFPDVDARSWEAI